VCGLSVCILCCTVTIHYSFKPKGHYSFLSQPGMKSPHRVLDPDVLAVEQENQKLEEEIFRIQLARERHKGEHGTSVPHMIKKIK